MDTIPRDASIVRRGAFFISPDISSISLLPIVCSISPVQRNRRAFDMAWNKISIIAAATARGVPIPALAIINPKFAMVE